jgi:hypothetical protein
MPDVAASIYIDRIVSKVRTIRQGFPYVGLYGKYIPVMSAAILKGEIMSKALSSQSLRQHQFALGGFQPLGTESQGGRK